MAEGGAAEELDGLRNGGHASEIQTLPKVASPSYQENVLSDTSDSAEDSGYLSSPHSTPEQTPTQPPSDHTRPNTTGPSIPLPELDNMTLNSDNESHPQHPNNCRCALCVEPPNVNSNYAQSCPLPDDISQEFSENHEAVGSSSGSASQSSTSSPGSVRSSETCTSDEDQNPLYRPDFFSSLSSDDSTELYDSVEYKEKVRRQNQHKEQHGE